MPTYPIITTSSDGKLIQFLGELDPKNASVVHHLKLPPKQTARFGDLNIYKKSDNAVLFEEKCSEYDIDSPKSDILVEFIYDLYIDDSIDYREVKAFPEGGGYYTVPNKPKAVTVATIKPGGGVGSRTGGEAL